MQVYHLCVPSGLSQDGLFVQDELRQLCLREMSPYTNRCSFLISIFTVHEVTDKRNIVKVNRHIQAPKLIHLVMVFTKPKNVERREQASYDQED